MKEFTSKYLQPFKSPSNNFIQIRLLTEKPMVSMLISTLVTKVFFHKIQPVESLIQ